MICKETAQELCDKYTSLIFAGTPVTKDSVQFRETEQAYMSGMFTMLGIAKNFEDSDDDNEATAMLQRLYDECYEFLIIRTTQNLRGTNVEPKTT